MNKHDDIHDDTNDSNHDSNSMFHDDNNDILATTKGGT